MTINPARLVHCPAAAANRTVDPWGALNPYSMWLQVLLISGLSLVGYAATRWLGNDQGILPSPA